ncbi:MAG: tRNA (adenosine(37)-N6)-threonylcarbamoyltransferase complex dimerization subunit type 1 TsaB [Streptococcaceae bacterium]|nr:tRNA (adenosine(37)-N6)-threonylcarbamoyltransferase complex dimerization subunit type 1 TsaB [Streptococcaceae bacterium]
MKLLAFDTSSQALSVALTEDETLLGKIDLNIKKNHSITLMPAIDFLLTHAGVKPKELDRIAVAHGPGSYTGLRIAVTTAKTLASTLKIDLVGVSSLAAIAANVAVTAKVVPLIDARRQNVYAGVYQNGVPITQECHTPLETLLASLKDEASVYFTGEVAPFRALILDRLPHAQLIEDPERRLPNAYQIARLARKQPPVAVDSFVPNYLKKVEAEEKWLETHANDQATDAHYIQKI